MPSALVIGGTRFIGRHTVSELLEGGYSVTLLNRGNHENPFADDDRVDHVAGDRRDDSALERAAEAASPDVVVDCIAMFPADVRAAVDVFSDVDAYVYVSSIGAYDHGGNPIVTLTGPALVTPPEEVFRSSTASVNWMPCD